MIQADYEQILANPLVKLALEDASTLHKYQKYGDAFYFEGHIYPVMELAVRIGRRLYLEPDMLLDLVVTSLLHDVKEDCYISKGYIKDKYGDAIDSYTDILTRSKNELYYDYISLILKTGPVPLIVKYCDLTINIKESTKSFKLAAANSSKDYIKMCKHRMDKYMLVRLLFVRELEKLNYRLEENEKSSI